MRISTVTRAWACSLALILVAACGAAAPTPVPVAATPRPTATPDPHLQAPASADDVYLALGRAGLRVKADNAVAGQPGDEPVKRINANYLGWPLIVSQFSSAEALAKKVRWDDEKPGRGEPAVAIAGMNILVQWGPSDSDESPPKPDAQKLAGLPPLVETLDMLLSPLSAHAIVSVAIPKSSPGPVADEPEATSGS